MQNGKTIEQDKMRRQMPIIIQMLICGLLSEKFWYNSVQCSPFELSVLTCVNTINLIVTTGLRTEHTQILRKVRQNEYIKSERRKNVIEEDEKLRKFNEEATPRWMQQTYHHRATLSWMRVTMYITIAYPDHRFLKDFLSTKLQFRFHDSSELCAWPRTSPMASTEARIGMPCGPVAFWSFLYCMRFIHWKILMIFYPLKIFRIRGGCRESVHNRSSWIFPMKNFDLNFEDFKTTRARFPFNGIKWLFAYWERQPLSEKRQPFEWKVNLWKPMKPMKC